MLGRLPHRNSNTKTGVQNEDDAMSIATSCEGLLREHPYLRVLARVRAGPKAIDFAVTSQTGENIVIRCVQSATTADKDALQTMLAQGPFTRALLVSNKSSDDIIYSCTIDSLPRALAAFATEGLP